MEKVILVNSIEILPSCKIGGDGDLAHDPYIECKPQDYDGLDLFAPEILEPRRRQLSVAHGVLDVLVAKVVLD